MKECAREVVEAALHIHIYVSCPSCNTCIDLLDSRDTDRLNHNEDAALLSQMFPVGGSNNDFECEEVTCTLCKTTFDVEGLEW